ncbi:MAG: TOBE domain-containing protein, partial [bacterium]|nr:TOBE domain-containing protein [bacterium]
VCMIRPEHIHRLDDRSGDENAVQAEIVSRTYHGPSATIEVRTPSGQTLSAIEASAADTPSEGIGATVTIGWSDSDQRILPAET